MNAVDGSEHYERTSDEPPPSLLTIILDTNPHAWSILSPTLPLSKAISNLLVFINAHLAFNNANKVAVLASHCQRAVWLYPSQSTPHHTVANADAPQQNLADGEDAIMLDGSATDAPSSKQRLILRGPKVPQAVMQNGSQTTTPASAANPSPAATSRTPLPTDDANKYRPFRLVESEILANLRALVTSTTESSIASSATTMIAGALTLSLAYINKQTQEYADLNGHSRSNRGNGGNDGREPEHRTMLQGRVLVLSVSGDLADQYIPIMNCIFAAQRMRIPLDILKLHGDTVFLQQASDATSGIYLSPSSPRGLLQYLMMAFLPDQTSRAHLVPPTHVNVDFRAACFCHRRVVEIGFVCSICLSIFCSPPPDTICLTCGTHLSTGSYGRTPAVVPRRKKKRKADVGATTNSNRATPAP